VFTFQKNKNFYLAIGSTVLFILYIVFFLGDISSCFFIEDGNRSLGLSFYYTKEMVQNFFEIRNQEQLVCYNEFLKFWDIIFAVIYTLMYSLWIALLLKKIILLIIPFLAMICDWAENYSEILMLDMYLNSDLMSESLIMTGSGINSAKWIFFYLTYLIILMGIIVKIKNYFKKNKKNLT
jgi:hypothetical protein